MSYFRSNFFVGFPSFFVDYGNKTALTSALNLPAAAANLAVQNPISFARRNKQSRPSWKREFMALGFSNDNGNEFNGIEVSRR